MQVFAFGSVHKLTDGGIAVLLSDHKNKSMVETSDGWSIYYS